MAESCRNCGEPVERSYCSACGQRADDRRRSIWGLLREFASEFFSLDGRHLRTAAALAIPGKLTRLWLEGRRASYVAPVRVYFVASLLLFLFIGFEPPDAEEYNVVVDGVVIGREQRDPDLGELNLSLTGSRLFASGLEPRMRARSAELQAMAPQELLDRLYARLEQTVPTALIVFVPLLAAALKLLYLRRPFFYVDHLVFALHFQSMLFVALLAARVVNLLLAAGAAYLAVFLVLAPAYLLVALRRIHRQPWPLTVLKGAALGVLYLVIFVVVGAATLSWVIQSM